MKFDRSSGVLLHITCLPSVSTGCDLGVGDMGPAAYQFVDHLHAAKQTIWQVLPLGPPARGNSPYSCYSAFAGNPLLISLDQVAAKPWFVDDPISMPTASNGDQETGFDSVDFETAGRCKRRWLQDVFTRHFAAVESTSEYQRFVERNQSWLPNFCRFESLMHHFDNANWSQWRSDLVAMEPDAIAAWDKTLASDIQYASFVQFLFDDQWQNLKRYANERQVKIFGDMPIFVAYESADVWCHQSLFELHDDGSRRLVAGVPPDYFSATGQLWGNPLYAWPEHQRTDYRWWIERFRFALNQFDLLRVDHFRGFEAYWEVPAEAETAMEGQWRKGPGAAPFDATRDALGSLPIIAEDLGMITEAVHELRRQLDFPAMRVLQFGFDNPDDVFHHPHHYPSDSVAYTGTHDNDTLMGWFANRPVDAADDAMLHSILTDQSPVHWQLIESVMASGSDMAIIPMQDLLGLGNECRMNLPGQAEGNWGWRMQANAFNSSIQAELAGRTIDSGRQPVSSSTKNR